MDILDLKTSKLQEILKIPVCKGPEIVEQENGFIGFTYAVDNIDTINDCYLKMRLCYPKARHIICAYIVETEGEEQHHCQNCCDDGEHGAGNKLLEYMIETT